MTDALKEEIKTRISGKSGTDTELEKLREDIRTLNERILVLQGEVVRVEFNLVAYDNGYGCYGLVLPAYFAYDDVAVRFEK